MKQWELLSIADSWAEVVKTGKIMTFKSIFYVKNYPNFNEEYDFRRSLFAIDIFWKLQFLIHFIS